MLTSATLQESPLELNSEAPPAQLISWREVLGKRYCATENSAARLSLTNGDTTTHPFDILKIINGGFLVSRIG